MPEHIYTLRRLNKNKSNENESIERYTKWNNETNSFIVWNNINVIRYMIHVIETLLDKRKTRAYINM